jgi:hypothetical protein
MTKATSASSELSASRTISKAILTAVALGPVPQPSEAMSHSAVSRSTRPVGRDDHTTKSTIAWTMNEAQISSLSCSARSSAIRTSASSRVSMPFGRMSRRSVCTSAREISPRPMALLMKLSSAHLIM